MRTLIRPKGGGTEILASHTDETGQIRKIAGNRFSRSMSKALQERHKVRDQTNGIKSQLRIISLARCLTEKQPAVVNTNATQNAR